jgi:hypothetical protein
MGDDILILIYVKRFLFEVKRLTEMYFYGIIFVYVMWGDDYYG